MKFQRITITLINLTVLNRAIQVLWKSFFIFRIQFVWQIQYFLNIWRFLRIKLSLKDENSIKINFTDNQCRRNKNNYFILNHMNHKPIISVMQQHQIIIIVGGSGSVFKSFNIIFLDWETKSELNEVSLHSCEYWISKEKIISLNYLW